MDVKFIGLGTVLYDFYDGYPPASLLLCSRSGTIINAQKRDRIPDPALLASRRDCIIGYWDLLHDHAPRPFEREIAVSLLGLKTPGSDWQDQAFDHLAEQCAYLIHTRGYEAWAL